MRKRYAGSTSRVVFAPGVKRVRAYDWGKGLVVPSGDEVVSRSRSNASEAELVAAIRKAYGDEANTKPIQAAS